MTTIDDRFWAKVRLDHSTGCWIWTGSLTKSGGYAQFSLDRRPVRVHRLMLELSLGRPLEPGKCSLHRCDTPACVNPDHLFEGTRLDNTRDMVSKKRDHFWLKGRGGGLHPMAKLTNQQAAEIRALRPIVTIAELSHRYGIAPRTVRNIIARRSYS